MDKNLVSKLKKIKIIYILGKIFKGLIEDLINYYYILLNKDKIRLGSRKNKVIYTCVTGDYDIPRVHKYYNPDWDYIFFTDNENLIKKKKFSMWEIRRIHEVEGLNNHYLNRWHKLFPNKLFPDYNISVYIDGNIRIMSETFFQDIQKKINKNAKFSSTYHPERNCLYDEAIRCIKKGLDEKEIIEKQIKDYRNEGFPSKFGMHEANILLRKHNDSQIIKLMQHWWNEVNNKAKRDQLSLTYCLWKMNFKLEYLDRKSYRYQKDKIRIEAHSRRRRKNFD